MAEITVREVTNENIDDLCRICVPSEKRDDPAFIIGTELKRKWAVEMRRQWGAFAKLAYEGEAAVGLIQYEPIPEERVVGIHCVYVPAREHWQQGVATQLLSSLIEGVKKRKDWFEGAPALALVTRTFPGGQSGQYPARDFFAKKGFERIGDDPDFLCYPLRRDFAYQPIKREDGYVLQEEDRGTALIIYGPSLCPFSYAFLKMAERVIGEIAPGMPIRWINRVEEPEEVKKRGCFEGCVVSGKLIRTSVLDRFAFEKEVREAI